MPFNFMVLKTFLSILQSQPWFYTMGSSRVCSDYGGGSRSQLGQICRLPDSMQASQATDSTQVCVVVVVIFPAFFV